MHATERRNFFRLPIDLPVKYSSINTDNMKDPSFNRALMRDLSGNGMRFDTTELIDTDKKLVVRFSLPYNEKRTTLQNFHLHAQVVRESQSEGDDMFGYGLQFVNIMPGIQDRIVKFLFDLQIATREQ